MARSTCRLRLRTHLRAVDFINAPVAMPILSVKRWNANGNRTILDEDSGVFIHKASGEEDPIVARNGVYFAKMIVKRSLLRQPGETTFGRPGTD